MKGAGISYLGLPMRSPKLRGECDLPRGAQLVCCFLFPREQSSIGIVGARGMRYVPGAREAAGVALAPGMEWGCPR